MKYEMMVTTTGSKSQRSLTRRWWQSQDWEINNEGMKIVSIVWIINIIGSKTLNVDCSDYRIKERIPNIKLWGVVLPLKIVLLSFSKKERWQWNVTQLQKIVLLNSENSPTFIR